MVGGDEKAFRTAEPLFADLAATKGYSRVGGPGSGHFAKMVHNAIEYAALQAYGEGFELLEASGFDYDLAALADLWNHGSVIRSWLLDLAKRAFEKSPDLAGIRGWVEDSGEGRWALEEAIDLDVPAPVIALSLMMRFHSRQDDSFSAKLIAALREQFGGHEVKES
jgi:6-phosphogluconate dehydrogenase